MQRKRIPIIPALIAWLVVTSVTSSPAQAPEPQTSTAAAEASSAEDKGGAGKNAEITDDQLKQMLVGKQLFLRGAYLGDSLSFGEHGNALGHPTVGSFALSGVEIDKVRVTRHKVELIGARYGLHFLGALPYEDAATAVDRVKITPRKKALKITIDRELVVKPKKKKEPRDSKRKNEKSRGEKLAQTGAASVQSSETDVVSAAGPSSSGAAAPVPEAGSQQDAAQAADPRSQTSTTSPAHAAQVLRDALGRIFASSLDDDVKSHMPEFWQLYYKAQAAKVDYRPDDANVLRSSAVDQQARLITAIAPDSNEFAQAYGIAGQALYRVVISPDGTAAEIAVERPIGFGLDENAVSAIRKATFSPAQKGGQPVAEALDLAVVFRIYSKRTSASAAGEAKAVTSVKPGPYSVGAQH